LIASQVELQTTHNVNQATGIRQSRVFIERDNRVDDSARKEVQRSFWSAARTRAVFVT
jgi:hypothetical protein